MIQVYLYEFIQAGSTNRWTSHDENVTVAGQNYLAVDMSHDKIEKTSDLSDSGTTISVATTDADNFLRGFLAGTPASPVHVRILESFGPAFTTAYLLFEADIQGVKFGKAGQIDVALSSVLRAGSQNSPRPLIQTPCNWTLGEPNTCRVNLPDYEIAGTIAAIAGKTVTVAACAAEATARGDVNWFALGRLVANTETRTIMAQAAGVLTLNAPLRIARVGDNVLTRPGCDRLFHTCGTKYGNAINFGGFPFMPTYNPLISAGVVSNKNSGKKGNHSTK